MRNKLRLKYGFHHVDPHFFRVPNTTNKIKKNIDSLRVEKCFTMIVNQLEMRNFYFIKNVILTIGF